MTVRRLTLSLFFACTSEMTSAHDLYKSSARGKRKVQGESSKSQPKKARVEEPTAEVPSEVPVVEVVESPPRRVESPRVEVVDEPQVEVPFVPSPVEEVGGTEKEVRKEVFAGVRKMTHERVDIVFHNKKYIKASSSFPGYNFGQAFSRGLNDITMV